MDKIDIENAVKWYIYVQLYYTRRLGKHIPNFNEIYPSIESHAVPSFTYQNFGDYIKSMLQPEGPRNYEATNLAYGIMYQLIYKDLFYNGFPTREDFDLHNRVINDTNFAPSYDELKRLEKICPLLQIHPDFNELRKQVQEIHKKVLRNKSFLKYIHYIQNEAIQNFEIHKAEEARINKLNSYLFKAPMEQKLEEHLNKIRKANETKIICNDIILILIEIACSERTAQKLCTSHLTRKGLFEEIFQMDTKCKTQN